MGPRLECATRFFAAWLGRIHTSERPARQCATPGKLHRLFYFFRPGANAIESRNNIIGQNNVGIHITKQRRRSVLFGLAEEVAQQRRAELVARNFRKMAESQLASDFRRALFAAKKKYFRPRDEARPTRDGIALDRRNMSAEILRYGKQGEHLGCQEYFLVCS